RLNLILPLDRIPAQAMQKDVRLGRLFRRHLNHAEADARLNHPIFTIKLRINLHFPRPLLSDGSSADVCFNCLDSGCSAQLWLLDQPFGCTATKSESPGVCPWSGAGSQSRATSGSPFALPCPEQ